MSEQRSLIAALRDEMRALHREGIGATPNRRVEKRIAELRQELLAPIRALEAKERVETNHTGAYTARVLEIERVVAADGAIAQALSELNEKIAQQATMIHSLRTELSRRPAQAARALTFNIPSEEDEEHEPHEDAFFKHGQRSFTVWRDAGVGVDRVTTLSFRTYYENKILARLRNATMKRRAHEVLENILMLCRNPGSEKFEARVVQEYTYLALSAFEGAGIATAVSKAQKVEEWDPSLRAAITDARKKAVESEKKPRDRSRSPPRRRSSSVNSNASKNDRSQGNGRGRGAGRSTGRSAGRGAGYGTGRGAGRRGPA